MRLELAPLGISVLTVMTGVVETQFAQNIGPRNLPANSQYLAIKDIISCPPNGKPKSGGTSARELAESLMDDILVKENGEMVWRGAQAGTVRFLSKWLPAFLLVGTLIISPSSPHKLPFNLSRCFSLKPHLPIELRVNSIHL